MGFRFFEELPETHFTLEENAAQKEEFIYQRFQFACFAEDTGLEIEVLNGEPGVFSARYAGHHKNSTDNIQLVLEKMENQSNRKAKFRTVICLIQEGDKYFFEGILNGKISETLRGNSGFGYDPIFTPEEFQQTLAEMDNQLKNSISHRRNAFKKMKEWCLR